MPVPGLRFRCALAFSLLLAPLAASAGVVELVINEVDADQTGTDAAEFVELYDGGAGSASLDGYALVFFNGDGDVSYAAFDLDTLATDVDGYFVLCGDFTNVPGCDLDVTPNSNLIQNGADAVALYQANASSFPAGTGVTVTNLVDALVYDTGDADDAGLLVLLNAGQPQVDEDSSSATTESNQRCPNGSGGPRNTSSYSQAAPTAAAANGCGAPAVPREIHEVQGSGATSPFDGENVIITGVVTGVKANGFFLQEAVADADPQTSEGILVFTDDPPPGAAAVGNEVEVEGQVSEFVPGADPLQPPVTEIVSPATALVSTGNPLPIAIELTSTLPDPAGAHDQLERLEGMRVSAAQLTVTGPTLGSVDEPTATTSSTGVFYGVIPPNLRPFREAGIPAPDPAPQGSIPPIPRFDSNPERIRVDSDALGGTALDVGAGAVVTSVTGPLDYSFRTYTILLDPGAIPAPAGGPTPTAVTTPATGEVTVAAYNLERFFDDVDDPAIGEPVLTPTAYGNRLKKASLAIRDYLKTPDILGIVECENLDTLFDLAAQITADAVAAGQSDPDYLPYLVEGNDIGGIDVGFLVKWQLVDNKVPRVQVLSVTQEGEDELFVNPNSSTELLNDRPSLVLDAIVHHPSGETFPVVVLVNHLRSLNGANSIAPGSNGWATAGARVRAKRQKQAEYLAGLVQDRQLADPAERIVLIGDFNFFEVNDGLTHGMGVVTGAPVPDDETAVPGDGIDLVHPNLAALQEADAAERYSFVFDGNAQSLDHALVNAPLVAATSARRLEHPRINADFPETDRNDYGATNPRRLADHDPLVAYFTVPSFATTIFKDGFESQGTERWSATTP